MSKRDVAKGKLVRHFGINVFEQTKYDRLLKKKNYGPGSHGQKRRRNKVSEYGRQLLEKQKVKFAYGVSETQLRNIFNQAKRQSGVTGSNMLSLLERRLDNVVYRLGLATTRAQARQMVSHGLIHHNGRRVNIPSALTSPEDVVTVKNRDYVLKMARGNLEKTKDRSYDWVELDSDKLEGKVKRIPARDDIPNLANEQLIVEFYAK